MFSLSVQSSRNNPLFILFTSFMPMTFFHGSFNSHSIKLIIAISPKICAIFLLSVATLSIRCASFLALAQQDK